MTGNVKGCKIAIIKKRIAILSIFIVGAIGGITATTITHDSTVPTGTLTEGQTLQADPSTMTDTAKAVSLIDQAKTTLCKTTITGVAYFSTPAAYVGQLWYQGLSALTLAQALATDKPTFDTAGNALMRTTITGKKYCASPSKWPSGMWAAAFSALAQARAYLVANPSQDGPSIKVVP